MNWEYFLTIGVLLVGLAVMIAAYVYSFQGATGSIFGSLYRGVPTANLGNVVKESNLDLAREAERWAQTSNREVTVWAVVFLIVALVVMLGHWRLYA